MTDLQVLTQALAGRYRVERELGRGGMATVYLAQDLRHDRPVALKLLHPEVAQAIGSERFLREIRVTAGLQHPHILPLYDSGRAEGEPLGSCEPASEGHTAVPPYRRTALLYYVMPYIEGESLRDRLNREGQLPLDDALGIAREVADALGFAHSRGIVHRDIKPENILLQAGHAVVADFGIARAISAASDDRLTGTGLAIGTPAYMSPEQASGEPDVDARSDIYAVATMLYEMLAGSPPFTGPTAQSILARRLTEPVPPLRAARDTVPEPVEQAIHTALARSPADRYPTAAAFLQGLSGAASAVSTRSIAVLPFANMSADPENEFFSDGITEEIINALTQVAALSVAARTSAFAFKGRHEDIGEIGRKLKVGTILEGSVRKAGNRLRVTAQLIKVADGYHLWSERYDRQLEDVFAVQDEIAEAITRELRVRLTEGEKPVRKKAPTSDVRAYEYYLRGRQRVHEMSKSSLEAARRLFDRAIDIDPEYALAHTGITDCSSFLYMYYDASRANLEAAETSSRRALELDPDSAQAHASAGLALSLTRQFDAAEREFETALRLDPRLFEAHYFYARCLMVQGKYEGTLEHYRQAWAIRPEDYQSRTLAVDVLKALGREDEMAAALQQAKNAVLRHLELYPDELRALYLGATVLDRLGEHDAAEKMAARAMAAGPSDPSVLYNLGCFYALRKDTEAALRCLEGAVDNGFGQREWFEHDSDLVDLHQEPRFRALLERMAH